MVATRAGWLERGEVVEVVFDPKVVSYEALVRRADQMSCAQKVLTRDDAQHEVAMRLVKERAVRSDGEIRTDDDKYFLARIMLGRVPMTPLQAARVNAIIRHKGDATPLLAPVQRALWQKILAEPDADWPSAIGIELREAWRTIDERAE